MSSAKFQFSKEGFAPNAQGHLIFLGLPDSGPNCGGDTCAFMDVNDICSQIHCNVPCSPSLYFTKAGPMTVAMTWIPISERVPINCEEQMMGLNYTEVEVLICDSAGHVESTTFQAGRTTQFWADWSGESSIAKKDIIGWMPLPPAMSQSIPVRK